MILTEFYSMEKTYQENETSLAIHNLPILYDHDCII